MFNRVELIGFTGADPEMRMTQTGIKVANLRLATSERWRDKTSGDQKEATEWHQVVCFNENLSGVIEKYVRKGSKIMVVGSLRTRKWQDQEGKDRWTTEVVIGNFNGQILLLDSAGSGRPPAAESPDQYGTQRTREPGAAQHERPMAPAADHTGYQPDPDLDDEIPF